MALVGLRLLIGSHFLNEGVVKLLNRLVIDAHLRGFQGSLKPGFREWNKSDDGGYCRFCYHLADDRYWGDAHLWFPPQASSFRRNVSWTFLSSLSAFSWN